MSRLPQRHLPDRVPPGQTVSGDTEKLLLPVRWAVLLIITLTAGYAVRGPHARLALGLILAAVVYNLGVALLARRGVGLRVISLLSPYVHATLGVAGTLATGGMNSDFHLVVSLVLAAVAMRHPFRYALIIGSLYLLAFMIGDRLLFPPGELVPLILFGTFNFCLLWLIATLVRQDGHRRTRLLQVAAHELRNPLAGVKGILSLLRRRTEAGRAVGDMGQLIGVMEREVDRLSALLDDILEAFRIQERQLRLRYEAVDMAGVVTQAVEPYAAGDEGHDFVVIGAQPGAARVWGDRRRLQEVVRNLISNAAKYSPDGGEVRVEVRTSHDRVLIAVSDQGLGIPRDQQHLVFDAFFRASNVVEQHPDGIGLGLYICSNVVRRLGGHIWVESTEGEGTTFFVALPRISHPSGVGIGEGKDKLGVCAKC